MFGTVKFSNVSKEIIGDFIAPPPTRYNQLGIFNIFPDIRGYVYAESHFPIIRKNLTNQAELRGASRSITYYATLSEQTLHRLYKGGNPRRPTLTIGKH